MVSEALAITTVTTLLDPELPAVGLLLAEPQGVAVVLVGVGVAHVLETGVTVSLLRVRPQLPRQRHPSKIQDVLFLNKILFSINYSSQRQDRERGWRFINYILVDIFIRLLTIDVTDI